PLEGGQPHRGVDAPAVAEGAGGAAVAEVERDDAAAGHRQPGDLEEPAADVVVAGAVEAVTADAVAAVEPVGQRVEVGLGRERLVERRGEDGPVEDVRERRPGGPRAAGAGRVGAWGEGE